MPADRATFDRVRQHVIATAPPGLSKDQFNALIDQELAKVTPPAAAPPEPTTGENIRSALKWGGNVIAGMTGMGSAGREAVENPTMTLATAALPLIGKQAAAQIPSKVSAGAKFQEVMGAAKDSTVDVSAPGNVALRIADLAQHGGGTNWGPAPVRQFIQYVTDPKRPPMTYEVARDFASNISKLSVDEMKRMSPAVRREVHNLRVTLNHAVEQAAEAAGKGDTYRSAMKEFASRSRLDDTIEDVWTGTKRALPWATVTGAAAYAGNKLADLLRGD